MLLYAFARHADSCRRYDVTPQMRLRSVIIAAIEAYSLRHYYLLLAMPLLTP